MKTTIIIYKRGDGYVADVGGPDGQTIAAGARVGTTRREAATWAARHMLRYAAPNPAGGELMAPPEVAELVPEHLRLIDHVARA